MKLDLIEYEAVPDAAPVDAGGSDPVDVPEAPAAVVDAPEPETAPDPFAGIDLDALRALSEVAPHLLQPAAPAPMQVQQGEEQGPPELDMFDPESVRAYMQWEREQTLGEIKQMVSPLSERAQAEQAAEQQELLKDAARDTETRLGEFIGDEPAVAFARQQMIDVARQVYPEVEARYGRTDLAAEKALEAAHARVKGYQDAIGKAAVEQHVNRNARLADQHAEPGLGGAASGVEVRPEGVYRPGELSKKYGQNAHLLRTGN